MLIDKNIEVFEAQRIDRIPKLIIATNLVQQTRLHMHWMLPEIVVILVEFDIV